MKKVLLAVCAVVFVAGISFAEFGASIRLGAIGEDSNFDKIEKVHGISSENDTSNFTWGADIFFEKAGLFGLKNESIFGIKAGYIQYSKEKVSFDDGFERVSFTSKAYGIPVIVYYKHVLNEQWRLSGGLGVNFIANKWEGNINGIKEDKNDSAISPLLTVGGEWLFAKNFSLSAELGYQFNAKFEDKRFWYTQGSSKEFLKRDLTGLVFNFAVNAYIF